jgi:peroxiredoxin
LFCASILAILATSALANGQGSQPDELGIRDRIRTLRKVPDSERGQVTRDIALAIRKLPASQNKVILAFGLANLSTEGDFGQGTLQEVATTLADAVKETPPKAANGAPDSAYVELAQLARYEHVKVQLNDPQYVSAQALVLATHVAQSRADFTLRDLYGKSWTRTQLKGKVVVVNFWATWCPPCRKEMPDLETLYKQFADKGLLVLAISSEPIGTVGPFIQKAGYTFPVLLDPGGTVNLAYHIDGIPNSFVYDRHGRLVAQAIDMRTRGQFLKMLAEAGLK